ncbi:MAG TPA: EAL domain-containing protein [Polyangiaceae bacterium]|nr:EAL domain-containing protein [Polyangiaceae bacterium]
MAGPDASPSLVGALTHEDIDVHFQPIVRLSTGEIFAHEALVRCKVPQLRNPMKLFEEAEREECCGRLGRLIREVAFERMSGVPVFVNLHPNELSERWLVRPDDPIGYHDSDVYLEITETAAFDSVDLTMRVLRDVCSRVGAKLVVDDLGQGHSDIFRVLEIEPDVVKLDRALVQALDKDPDKQKRLSYFVDLCTELGAVVVVEGVETEDELMAVRDTGAPYVQGYLLARPAYPPPTVSFKTKWKEGMKSQRPKARTSDPALLAVKGDPLRGVRSRLAGISLRERVPSEPPSGVEDRVTPLHGEEERDALSDLFTMSEPEATEETKPAKKSSEELDIGALLFPTDPD